MPTCFVIQPFDGGPYDKRYDDVLVPAIKAAGLEPYRVDRDPGTSVLIEDIESGIRRADVCLADISLDNPNVWFELGFALASSKPVVLICSAQRTSKYPFDVQHRTVTSYKTESTRDFEELQKKITERLNGALRKAERITTAVSMPDVETGHSLAPHELATLVATAENTTGMHELVSGYTIRQDTERAGFTKVAVTLAFGALVSKGLLEYGETEGDYGAVPSYCVKTEGYQWLSRNEHLLELQKDVEVRTTVSRKSGRVLAGPISDLTDDDIPF